MIKCDINKVIISGRAAATPMLVRTAKGSSLMFIRLVSEGVKHNEISEVTVWGELAEKIAPDLKGGDRIMVEGSLHHRADKNEEGVRTTITANRIFALEKQAEFEEEEGLEIF